MKTSDFKDLKVWQKSMEAAVCVYKIIKMLPNKEKYGLSDQIRRCAISIPSNIAEGQARHTAKDFNHFLSISRGSTAEIQTQLLLCAYIGYILPEYIQPLIDKYTEIDKMLAGLMASLFSPKHQLKTEN